MHCTIFVGILLFISNTFASPVKYQHEQTIVEPDGVKVIEISFGSTETNPALVAYVDKVNALFNAIAEKEAIIKLQGQINLEAGQNEAKKLALMEEIKEKALARAQVIEKEGWALLNRKFKEMHTPLPCQVGLIDGTITGLKNTLDGAVGDLQDVINTLMFNGTLLGPVGEAVDSVGNGAGTLLIHAFDAVYDAVNDVACGVGSAANNIASGLDTGDIVGGAVKALGDIGGTVVNTLANVGGQVLGGVGDAVDDILGFLTNPFATLF